MSMYLGMTKDDYLNVLKKTPRSVADKLGIENASVLSDELLVKKFCFMTKWHLPSCRVL